MTDLTPEERAALIWEDESYIGTTGDQWRDWVKRKLTEQIRAAVEAERKVWQDITVSILTSPVGDRVWLDIGDAGFNLGPVDFTTRPVLDWWERIRSYKSESQG